MGRANAHRDSGGSANRMPFPASKMSKTCDIPRDRKRVVALTILDDFDSSMAKAWMNLLI